MTGKCVTFFCNTCKQLENFCLNRSCHWEDSRSYRLYVYSLQLTYLICQFIDGCGLNVSCRITALRTESWISHTHSVNLTMACVWRTLLLNIFIVSGISSNVLTGMSSIVLRSWFGLDITLKTPAHILINMLFIDSVVLPLWIY